MKLEPIRREKLHLNTFGSDTFATKAWDVVRLSLQRPGQSDTIEIIAYTSPGNFDIMTGMSKLPYYPDPIPSDPSPRTCTMILSLSKVERNEEG